VQLVKRTGTASERVRRDPRAIVAMLMAALAGAGYMPV
jgi:hypothetical protein